MKNRVIPLIFFAFYFLFVILHFHFFDFTENAEIEKLFLGGVIVLLSLAAFIISQRFWQDKHIYAPLSGGLALFAIYETTDFLGEFFNRPYYFNLIFEHMFEIFSIALITTGLFLWAKKRKSIEEGISHLYRLLRTIRDINQLIVREKDRDMLFKLACNILAGVNEYRMAWIGIVDEANKKLIPIARAGFDAIHLELIDIELDEIFMREDIIGDVIKSKMPVTLQDVLNNENYRRFRGAALAYKYKSIAVLPIIINEKVYGVLNVYSEKSNSFCSDEMSLLSEAAGDIAFAVKMIEIEKGRKQAEKDYKDLIESLPICVKWFDKNGKLIFINKEGRKEHFLKDDEVLSDWDYLDTVDSEFKEIVKKSMDVAIKGESSVVEFKYSPQGSVNQWCNAFFNPLEDEKGKINGFLFISINITERKKIEEKTKEIEDTKSKFIQIISHQMRTPLSAMRWNLELLMGDVIGQLSEDQKNLIKSTYDADVEIISRVNDLTLVMDIEENKIKLEKTKTYPESLIKSLVLECEARIKSKKIKILFENQKIKSELNVDPFKIKKAISKLIDNAISYTREGGQIEIKIEENKGEAFFTVSDNGIGIPPDDQCKIFNKFYRATNAISMSPDSSGLGLFIAKALIGAHGGKVWFNSTEGKGSDFYFKLPIENQ